MVSIIIPIYNEEKILKEHFSLFKRLTARAELIFVDGGSIDESCEIASTIGRVLKAEKNRAVQMNCGAESATSNLLLFLHADTIIFPEAIATIESQALNNGFAGGCLTQRINNSSFIYRLIESFGNIRILIQRINQLCKGFKTFFSGDLSCCKLHGFNRG